VRALRHAACDCALAVTVPSVAGGQTLALGDIVDRIQTGARIAGLSTTNPSASLMIDSLAAYFARMDARPLTLDELSDIFGRRRERLATVARWNRDRVALFGNQAFVDSLVQLTRLANVSLQPVLRPKVSASTFDSLWRPLDSLGTLVRARARADNQEKLRRFEIKYGPASPHLNVAEVGLNYGAQLVLGPWFLPSTDGWPSPNEIVASYRTTDLTAAQSAAAHLTARVVSSAQLGLRRYSFDVGCGKGRFADLVHPCQSSGGLFLMGPSDAPLARIWGAGSRGGVYLARGGYHAGVVLGGEKRLVFGADHQILPYLF
jgi:hypothetical protein